jgi:hypothetical protein
MILYQASQSRDGKNFTSLMRPNVKEALDNFFSFRHTDFDRKILVERWNYDPETEMYSREEEDWFWYFDPKKL